MIGSKINQMVVWVLLAALLAACGTDQGALNYEQGRYDQAAAEWRPLSDTRELA